VEPPEPVPLEPPEPVPFEPPELVPLEPPELLPLEPPESVPLEPPEPVLEVIVQPKKQLPKMATSEISFLKVLVLIGGYSPNARMDQLWTGDTVRNDGSYQ